MYTLTYIYTSIYQLKQSVFVSYVFIVDTQLNFGFPYVRSLSLRRAPYTCENFMGSSV